MKRKTIRIWDLPTRVFHWSLVLVVAMALLTGQLGGGLIEWHGKLGLCALFLVVFRLAWGVLGSTYARFAQFFPTPGKIRAYLTGQWHGEGHNPFGALSVIGLLLLLTLQVTSGLFANDDIAFFGPLYSLVGPEVSKSLTRLHHKFGDLLIILIVLHVAAIFFYAHVRKQNLIKPMLTGLKEVEEGESAQQGGWLALLVSLLLAASVVFFASGMGLDKAPEPVAESIRPSW